MLPKPHFFAYTPCHDIQILLCHPDAPDARTTKTSKGKKKGNKNTKLFGVVFPVIRSNAEKNEEKQKKTPFYAHLEKSRFSTMLSSVLPEPTSVSAVDKTEDRWEAGSLFELIKKFATEDRRRL